jgi:hypothetical protein
MLLAAYLRIGARGLQCIRTVSTITATIAVTAHQKRMMYGSDPMNEWLDIKIRLAGNAEYAPILREFTKSLDQRMSEWTQPFKDLYDYSGGKVKGGPPYDIFALEENLSSLSTLLDRCLTYRREDQELEIAAVQQAMAYDLHRTQRESLMALELAEAIKNRYDAEATAQTQASNKFHDATRNNALAAGFKEIADGTSNSLCIASQWEQTRWGMVKCK